ncbi:hypothetical protein CDD82_4971 [Ophiocordyceps australis]|uniref:Transcription factor CBF/NF-Y/archaeal histone domain-containing protein n=1 Tax=Ophiocordyceps australis TaxID=1399860 RepID=A0A2C5Z4P2_9HYPO|nr:hypothetical protein CDD82_4971 [Ophiocordyceps australis]
MPYNTTAIPPRREPTGQTQLPLSRVKKIINQDADVVVCSNNAAFVITCATEMFIQHLAAEAHAQARLERKPRRNVQYKDLANAISHKDNLEFLQDIVPKTVPFNRVKDIARHTQARLRGEKNVINGFNFAAAELDTIRPFSNGLVGGASIVNGHASSSSAANVGSRSNDDSAIDPNDQLTLEASQAAHQESPFEDADVPMSG